MNNIKSYIRQLNIWEVLYSIAFGVMCILSRHVVDEPTDRSTVLTTYVIAFSALDIVIYIIAFIGIFCILQIAKRLINIVNVNSAPRNCSKQRLAIVWIIIFVVTIVLWIPYLMSYWPGGIYNDTLDSIHIALGKQEWSNQNTVLYALWWRLIFWIGQIADQGDYGGLKLMTIVQPMIMASVSASFFTWLYERGSKVCYIIGALSVALFPIFPYYAVSMWKDTLFSVNVFLLTWLLYTFTEKDRIAANDIVKFIVLSLLVIFGRNNGIYIFIVTAIVLIITFAKKKDKKKLIIAAASVIVASVIIQGPVFKLCGVQLSGSAEKYGIPLQQVGYMISSNAKMSAEERAVMEGVLPIEGWINLYNPTVSDSIKFDPLFCDGYLATHQGEFIKAYLGMTLKNPDLAFKGYIISTIGFWDAFKSSTSGYICTAHCWNAEYFMSDYFNLHTGLSLSEIVGPRIIISSGLLVWIMLGMLTLALSAKKWKMLPVMMPCIALWITLMIATPIAYSFRYVFSLLLCIPVYILTLVSLEKE